MLKLEDVHASYGKIQILRGVNLEVRAGESVALLGRNGVGKTTTLRAIMGLMPVTQGRIDFLGDDLGAVPAHRIAGMGIGLPAAPEPLWPQVPAIADETARDWRRPGHDGILCHCELVTRREVRAALEGPLGARSMGGLKRRTRVMMGRCQGFHCGAELAALTQGRFAGAEADDRARDG